MDDHVSRQGTKAIASSIESYECSDRKLVRNLMDAIETGDTPEGKRTISTDRLQTDIRQELQRLSRFSQSTPLSPATEIQN